VLPNLLVIGAAKAGTTTLSHYLAVHPQIYMAPDELHFFDLDSNWLRGLDWYAEHFSGARDEKIVGEKTPAYTRYPHRPAAAPRAATAVPDARLIYVVRDPVERIRSHVIHEMRHGRERRRFADAALNNPLYVDASRYAMQAHRWLERFPRASLLIVESERLHAQTAATMREIYEFLDVDASFEPPPAHLNNASVALQSSPTSQRLRGHAAVRALTALTPRTLRDSVKDRLRRWEHANALQAEISPELRSALESRLRDDVVDLAELMPAGFTGWGLLPAPPVITLPGPRGSATTDAAGVRQ
jgi:hypothetical protein